MFQNFNGFNLDCNSMALCHQDIKEFKKKMFKCGSELK